MRWVRVFIFVISASLPVMPNERPCTIEQAKRADAAVDSLSSWDKVHSWYARYRQCDDGGPGEGVSEGIARNLVDRWRTLPRLAELTRNEPGFRRFILKHVDATLNGDDLRKIDTNATSGCPAGLHSFCKTLSLQSQAALKEQSQ